MGTQVKITREETIRENIKSFQKLSPSEKIKYVEKAKKRLKYFYSLCAVAAKDFEDVEYLKSIKKGLKNKR
ncbi:MAG: hypothetical protein HY755_03790 [Nitrospirae bacterium]|nr:hypothetical protein [Nitrospirota bacterium]